MTSPRYLCSHLVRLVADHREQWVVLETIWKDGAVLECEESVSVGIPARIVADGAAFAGRITSSKEHEDGCQVEMEFSPLTPWSLDEWRPDYGLDPAELPL